MSITTEAILCYGIDLSDKFNDDAEWLENKIPDYFQLVIHGGDGYSKLILAIKASVQIVEPGNILVPDFEEKHHWDVLFNQFAYVFSDYSELKGERKWYLACSRF